MGFSVFYTFLQSLPSVSIIFDILAFAMAYHFKNSRMFFMTILYLILHSIHLLDSIYQAHLIISILYPISYFIMLVDNEKEIFFRKNIIKFAYMFFLLIFAFITTNITTFSSDISSNEIFGEYNFYGFFSPISQLSFVLFWFFATMILIYILRYGLNIIYFVAYFLSYLQFLFYSDKAIGFYEFGGMCFCFYFIYVAYKLMFYDQLTGVLNRRAYERIKANSYFLAIADIDHFKQFNDKWGHEVGDLVLKNVAKIMKKTCKNAKIYRIGGEEFVFFFKTDDEKNVLKTLESLRLNVQNAKITFKNQKLNVTISIGCSKNLKTKEDSLKLADEKLYKAKENGRNQIVG